MANEDLTPPKPGAGDATRSLVKAGVSAAPVIGGPAAELFELVVPSSLNRRRQEWFERVAAKLRELEAHEVNLGDLANDEGFITLLIEASKAALGTHLEEKLDLLANCVASAALPADRDDFMAMRLLQYVEELSPEHFVVLTYLADPEAWYEVKGIERPKGVMGPRRANLERANLGVVIVGGPPSLEDRCHPKFSRQTPVAVTDVTGLEVDRPGARAPASIGTRIRHSCHPPRRCPSRRRDLSRFPSRCGPGGIGQLRGGAVGHGQGWSVGRLV